MNIKSWIKVCRLQTALVTISALWLGFISVRPLDLYNILILFTIGLLVHIWGFLYNNVRDADYDRKHGEIDNLIAKGEIDRIFATVVSWSSIILALVVAGITYSTLVFVFLALSVVPGYLYDKYSKYHWWSNFYLSAWVVFMVLVGASAAGNFTIITYLISGALAIQIAIQVVEGDLKDLDGPEHTLAEWLGVCLDNLNIIYSVKFKSVVYGLKGIEILLVFIIIELTISTASPYIKYIIWLLVFIGVLFFFVLTLQNWQHSHLNEYGREKIKENASKHEIVSIWLLAAGVFWLDAYGAVLIAVAPPLWYVGVNSILHSGILNPDI